MKNKVEQNFITYRTTVDNKEERRDIVVINGQPYYRSTGKNSSIPDTWLPFVCIKGHQENLNTQEVMKLLCENEINIQFYMALINSDNSDNYIIKLQTLFFGKTSPLFKEITAKTQQINQQHSPIFNLLKRCVTPECLAVSSALGGGIWNNAEYNSLIKINYLDKVVIPDPITLNKKPEFETDNPKIVNEWLGQSEANYISQIFKIEASQNDSAINSAPSEGAQVKAFMRIYNALYAGQSSLFKLKADHSQLTLDKIQAYVAKNENSRSAKAWKLAQAHSSDISSNNHKLFKSIHNYSFKRSSSFFSLFKQSKNFPEGYGEDIKNKIDNAGDDSRTGKIRNALN